MKHLDTKILTFGRYYKIKTGYRVHKVPIALSGFTCPNIDGTKAKGGCTFCENESFSPNFSKNINKIYLTPTYEDNQLLTQQLKELHSQFYNTTQRLKKTHKTQKFIIYFQAFTNTYATLNSLKKLYETALSFDNVIGISIGTRADSISDDVLSYLQELSKSHEIWIEYGIQSSNDNTLKLINRAEKASDILATVKKTHNLGINVCTHFIFGLPNEDQKMMLETVKKTLECGVESIKIHPLYVVNNTLLASQYKQGHFTPITQELYIDTLIKAIELIPKNIMIQRISAGIDNSSLIAPKWCKNKNSQMKIIRKELLKKHYIY